MKRLYYATFEKGFSEIVKKVLKRTDKNSKIKTLYDDAVLFFADEHFKFIDSCFFDAFIVIQNIHKPGVGALNITIKSLLEKKDLKIAVPRDVSSVKLTIKKENEKVLLDNKLKSAFEVMIKRVTKKGISYFAKEELVLLAKNDGENLFMKRMQTQNKFVGLAGKYDIRPETAYLMCVMSEPQQNETVLDANSENGIISFVRANSFVKANVIASTDIDDEKEKLKKLAKKCKSNTFSVLGYNFLEDNFPIKYIDKIITDLTSFGFGKIENLHDFYDKAYACKVKTLVVANPKNYDINRFIVGKFEKTSEIFADKFNAYVLKLIEEK